jgi:nitrite reductase/ring-hydroxylating ferredoxin subunit
MFHYFRYGKDAGSNTEAVPANQAPVRALPASWYTSQDMYNFERRAIFSKRWLFLTHKSRLAETGDWLRYTIAGFDIIITRDRQGTINAFHNVCRHRAYPVVEQEKQGKAKILACRYHGWSYGLNGKLAKAPGYQDLEFNKEQNGLLRIHVKVDRNGFVWINMDAKVAISFFFCAPVVQRHASLTHQQGNPRGLVGRTLRQRRRPESVPRHRFQRIHPRPHVRTTGRLQLEDSRR